MAPLSLHQSRGTVSPVHLQPCLGRQHVADGPSRSDIDLDGPPSCEGCGPRVAMQVGDASQDMTRGEGQSHDYDGSSKWLPRHMRA